MRIFMRMTCTLLSLLWLHSGLSLCELGLKKPFSFSSVVSDVV